MPPGALTTLRHAPIIGGIHPKGRPRTPLVKGATSEAGAHMKKALIALGVVVAVLGAAAAAVPWYVGYQAQANLNEWIAKANAAPDATYRMSVASYDRGWRRSVVVVRIAALGDPKMFIDLRQRIDHGPDPRFGWLAADLTPLLEGDMHAALQPFFGDEPAFRIASQQGFDGVWRMTIASPAFDKPLKSGGSATLAWGGATGTGTMTPDGRLVFSVTAPRLALAASDGSFAIAGLKLESDGVFASFDTAWSGTMTIGFKEVTGAGGAGELAVRDASLVTTQKDQGATLRVGLSLKVGAVRWAGDGPQPRTASDIVWEVELDQLDKRAIQKYSKAVAALDTGGLPPAALAAGLQGAVLELAGDLLRGSPVLRVKRVGFTTADGAFSAEGAVSFHGAATAGAAALPDALQRVKFKGSAKVGRRLLQTAIAERSREAAKSQLEARGDDASEDSLKLAADRVAEAQVQAFEQAGLVRAEGADVAIDAAWEKGELTINGKPAEGLGAMLTGGGRP
jgi:uncharacterized protein YdgA (DUF945 family)